MLSILLASLDDHIRSKCCSVNMNISAQKYVAFRWPYIRSHIIRVHRQSLSVRSRLLLLRIGQSVSIYISRPASIMEENKFQTKHRCLNATNACPQLGTNARLNVQLIQTLSSLASKVHTPQKRCPFVHVADAVVSYKALDFFVWNFFFLVIIGYVWLLSTSSFSFIYLHFHNFWSLDNYWEARPGKNYSRKGYQHCCHYSREWCISTKNQFLLSSALSVILLQKISFFYYQPYQFILISFVYFGGVYQGNGFNSVQIRKLIVWIGTWTAIYEL